VTSGPGELRLYATAPLRGPGLAVLEALGSVVLDPWLDAGHGHFRVYDPGALAERPTATGADVVVAEADTCAGPVLDLPLRAVCSTRGDPTNVDVAAATERGIPVLHAPGRNADAVAELTVGLTLAVLRRIVPADRDVRAGQVFRDGTLPYQRFRGGQLGGRAVGLVGLGAVGRAVRWRFEALGTTVRSFDPFVDEATDADLDVMVGEVDVVSLHAAPTPDTVGLFDAERFARMRPGAIFVNTARAALHDLEALVAALESGRLGGAAIDHFTGEVLPADHPITRRDDVVLTPHIGGATIETEANHTALVAEGLSDLLAGRVPRTCVNPEVLA
jgi:D-3-phosphoglycerate dehydrogenase